MTPFFLRRTLPSSFKPSSCARLFATESTPTPLEDGPGKIPPSTSLSPSQAGWHVAEQDPSELERRARRREERAAGRLIHGWKELRRKNEARREMGAILEQTYKPHTLLTNPPSPKDITLELLMASQAHMGHSTSLWNPKNSQYIFGARQGIHIISLEITAAYLKRACRVVEAVAERGGLILFVGTRKGQDRCVIKAAQLAKGCHLFERWIPGSLTNGQQILGSCRMMVVDELDQEMPEYNDQLDDLAVLKPDLVVCLNPLENEVLLHECGLHNIPTIGVIDTDANPTWVTYPIPANDDSLRCIQVIAGVLGRAGEQGHAKRLELAEEGKVLYDRSEMKRRFEQGSERKSRD